MDGTDEPTDRSVVKVTTESFGRERTVYLEPGNSAEVRADSPNVVSVNVDPIDHAELPADATTGGRSLSIPCPECGERRVVKTPAEVFGHDGDKCHCNACEYSWGDE